MHHVNKLHKSLEPLKWLVGKWKTIKAEISHPTKPQTLKFTEHMEFLSFGAPLLVFSSKSNRVKQGGKARHLERGFLSINDDHYTVAFATVASLTLSTLEEGYVQDQCLCLKSASIAEKKFSMYPAVRRLHRCYRLNENGELEYTLLMETAKTGLSKHADVVYKKVAEGCIEDC